MSGKLLLRHLDRNKPVKKEIVLTTLHKKLKLPIISVRETHNGINIQTEFQKDIEQLLTAESRKLLKELGLEASLHPKLRAQRSVICRRVDSIVGEHSGEEIIAEINRCNTNLKAIDVVKFGSFTHIFKIELENTTMANHIKQNGFLCYDMKITGNQTEQENYTDVQICFKCYKMEDHTTALCPTPNLIICSECAQQGHTHRDCQSTTKKCINCGQGHRTLAMGCPNKKKIIENKRKEVESEKVRREEATYAKVATSTAQTFSDKVVKTVTERVEEMKTRKDLTEALDGSGIRAMIIILDAHIQNLIEPGSYNSRINEVLKANNIPPIVFPPNPNSSKLLEHEAITHTITSLTELQKTMAGESEEEEMEVQEARGAKTKQKKKDKANKRPINDDDVTSDEEILTRHLTAENVTVRNASEYEIEIISLNTEPRENLTSDAVKKKFENHSIKYKILNNSKVTVELFESLINQNKIKEHNSNITYLPPAEFKKVRNGKDRTPNKENAKKNKSSFS
jgi:hypothetical protein